jgi:hypothetical protein
MKLVWPRASPDALALTNKVGRCRLTLSNPS